MDPAGADGLTIQKPLQVVGQGCSAGITIVRSLLQTLLRDRVQVGRYAGNGRPGAALPDNMFPTGTLLVRNNSEGAFSLQAYAYEADLAGAMPDFAGGTCFLEVLKESF